ANSIEKRPSSPASGKSIIIVATADVSFKNNEPVIVSSFLLSRNACISRLPPSIINEGGTDVETARYTGSHQAGTEREDTGIKMEQVISTTEAIEFVKPCGKMERW